MSLLIFVLICAGITFIITKSSIFEAARDGLSSLAVYFKSKNEVTPEDILVEEYQKKFPFYYRNFCLSQKLLESDYNNPEYQKLLTSHQNDYMHAIKKYKYDPFNNILSWFCYWGHKLVTCPMCTGFWVGTIMSLNLSTPIINIFYISSPLFYGFIISFVCYISNVVIERIEANANN